MGGSFKFHLVSYGMGVECSPLKKGGLGICCRNALEKHVSFLLFLLLLPSVRENLYTGDQLLIMKPMLGLIT